MDCHPAGLQERGIPSESGKQSGTSARSRGSQNEQSRYSSQGQENYSRHNDRSGGSMFSKFSSWIPQPSSHSDPYPAMDHEDTTERYRRERNEARRLNESLSAKVSKLEQELSAQHEAVYETKESATRVVSKAQEKELFIGPQALDRTISEKFTTLFKNIRSSSRLLAGGDPVNLESFRSDVREQFRVIAPGLDDAGLSKLLNGRSTRRYFLQGWIALVMTERLFPTLPDEQYSGTKTKDLWLEEAQAGDLWYLEKALFTRAVSPKDFNDWRAYSASLLSKSLKSEDLPSSTIDYLWKLCSEVMETARVWCSGPQDQQKMAAELLNIFSEAVHFVRLLRTQRAQWSLRFPKPYSKPPSSPLPRDHPNYFDSMPQSRVMFDHSTMKSIAPHDDDERTDNKFVQIFITPALFKRGDSDGEKFDVFSCIDTSIIMWGELSRHLPPPPQSPAKPKKPLPPPRSISGIAGPERSRGLDLEEDMEVVSEPRDMGGEEFVDASDTQPRSESSVGEHTDNVIDDSRPRDKPVEGGGDMGTIMRRN
ncbi:hypothetical protein VTL71DRAFT_9490 [Oculimacula yallundae]|uniref:Uncharacterized protein n=1 Tax=Oculimacula yallundae TaxID=86028 RepID=A0ABR4BS23_9HELO